MEKDKLSAASSGDLDEFRSRGSSSIFSSLRPKKENKTKKRFSASKSIFSTLMLANYEEQFYISTGATLNENLSYEAHKEKLQEKINKKIMKEKALKELETKTQILSGDKSTSDTDDCIDENVNHKVVVSLNIVDSVIQNIYEDVLFIILNRLNKTECKYDEEDLIKIDENSVLQYVQDAFGMDEGKHEELLAKVKELQTEEFSVVTKSSEGGFKSHINLLKILLKHEIESSRIPQHYWSGNFSFLATSILSLHADFQMLDETLTSFAKWTAFSEIHYQYPLALKTFKILLDSIVDVYIEEELNLNLRNRKSSILPACLTISSPSFQQKALEAASNRCCDQLKSNDFEIQKSFWNSSQKLSEAFTKLIRNIHIENEEIDVIEILRGIFELEKRIEKILPMDLISISNSRFVELVKKALTEGTAMHLHKNVKRKVLKSSKNEKRLNELMRLMSFAEDHLRKMTRKFTDVFEEFYTFSFTKHLYKVYDTELSFIVKPIVTQICDTKEGNIENYDKFDEVIAKKLFGLYLQLKSFSDRGSEIYGYELKMAKYYEWFTENVNKWNRVSVFDATTRYGERIVSSIDKDNFKHEIKGQLFSSSAIDTMQILYSVKKFWQELKWADEAREAEIKNNVAHDIYRFTTIYFEKLSDRIRNLESMKNTNSGIYKMPIETFIAIANFNYVSKETETCVADLTKNNENVQKVFENTQKFEAKAIRQLLEFTFKMTSPTIRKLMLEGAEKDNYRSDDIADRLMVYVEDTLNSLHQDLSCKDIKVAKEVFWEQILVVLEDVIQVSIQRQMTPHFFSNLKKIFSVLKEIFNFTENETLNLVKVKRIDHVLERYGLNTDRLIHQYFKDRYEMQNQIHKTPFTPNGMLTVYAYFTGNVLKVEILNARNLIPLGPNKKCHPFVKISIEPRNHFTYIKEVKTKVQQDTHFPLYDEIFEFNLSQEQKNIKDAILFFNIKSRCLIIDECIAEAFLSFKDIPEFSSKDKFKQIHLTLTRLQSDEIESLKALKHRAEANDKDAKDFLSKLKSKTLISPKKLRLPITQL